MRNALLRLRKQGGRKYDLGTLVPTAMRLDRLEYASDRERDTRLFEETVERLRKQGCQDSDLLSLIQAVRQLDGQTVANILRGVD